MGKLTALQVEKAKPGLTLDSDGLYLQVGQNGNRSWIYRYTLNGKTRDMGLGSTKAITLKKARELAAEARALRAQGFDPIEHRRQQRSAVVVEAAKAVTFAEAAERFIIAHEAGWRNPKSRLQWRNTIATYANPVIGQLPTSAIDTNLVMKILQPAWATKTPTMERLRGRIESILDWAKTMGLRQGENPARWKGHLDNLLPAKSKVRKVEHHAAVPYHELPAFMEKLRARSSVSARALEFCILTASRAGEVAGARWGEFNLETALWIIPPQRMKNGREHRVPLSRRAMEIIKQQKSCADGELVWGLSTAALAKMLTLMGQTETVHGFRSSFKDWCSERTNFRSEISEAALAHISADKVKAAYERTRFEELRRELMEMWSQYCDLPPMESRKVVPLHKSA
jgi:integrase